MIIFGVIASIAFSDIWRRIRPGLPFWAVWLCLGFGFYLLLAGTFGYPELMVGFAAALAGATCAALLRRERPLPFRIDRDLLVEFRGVPLRALSNSLAVYGRLLLALARGRRLGGRVRAVAFADVDDDPRSRARRALMDYVVCLTPLTVSFGVDRERRLLVFHELDAP